MYLAQDNLGIYLELELLIEHIEDKEDEDWLDYFLVKFRKEGLTLTELKDAVGMIEDYLPAEIECDSSGCYIINNEVEGKPAITYIPRIDTVPTMDLQPVLTYA